MVVVITNFYQGAVLSIRENKEFDELIFFKSMLDFWGQQMSGSGNPMSRLFFNARVSVDKTPQSSSQTTIQQSVEKSKKKGHPTHYKVDMVH